VKYLSKNTINIGKKQMKTRLITVQDLLTRTRRAVKAFRQPIAPDSPKSIYSRPIESNAANLIIAADKVRQILNGEIPLPETVELFITNFCDFACPHCRCAPYRGDEQQFMNYGLLERLLGDLSAKGLKTIELGGGGEPLAHPQIQGIFDKFNEHSFRIAMITNGYRFTAAEGEGLADSFLQCGDFIRFSLDGISNKSFQAVHGRRDVSYDSLRRAIVSIANKVRAKQDVDQRPKIGLKMIIQKSNQHEALGLIDEALAVGAHFVHFKMLENHPFALGEERVPLIEKLKEKVAGLDQDRLYVDILPGYGGEPVYKRCKMAVLHPVIDWDGAIYLCAFFHNRKEQHTIGNINDGGFFAHWGTPHHKERIEQVDLRTCVPNCPIQRYEPAIDFIRTDGFRFRYI
jgi:radical SAM protein with 4Fe4S-binding SPASM domain